MGGVHRALPGKGPLPFPDLPGDGTRTAVGASSVAVSGCRGELSPHSSPEDRTWLVQHPLRQAQAGPLRAGGLATRSPAEGASVRRSVPSRAVPASPQERDSPPGLLADAHALGPSVGPPSSQASWLHHGLFPGGAPSWRTPARPEPCYVLATPGHARAWSSGVGDSPLYLRPPLASPSPPRLPPSHGLWASSRLSPLSWPGPLLGPARPLARPGPPHRAGGSCQPCEAPDPPTAGRRHPQGTPHTSRETWPIVNPFRGKPRL